MILKKNEILDFLKGREEDQLFKKATFLRKKFFQDRVLLRAIINFSNHCIRDCLYCGLRQENSNLNRYRMSLDEILNSAREAVKKGLKTIVLQSGDDPYYSRRGLVGLIKAIKALSGSVAVTLSIGERSSDDYKSFYDAGADRYLMKHETANESLYNSLHPNQSFKERLDILYLLRKIGYQVGLGHIVGLPNQSLKDLARDIMLYQDFQPDMIGLGPFIPAAATPLYSNCLFDIKLLLRSYALARVVTENAHIPLTTASIAIRERVVKIREIFDISANVVMADITPKKYSIDYKIYDNRPISSVQELDNLIRDMGFYPAYSRGDSLKKAAKKKKNRC
jgi:biotin synthase